MLLTVLVAVTPKASYAYFEIFGLQLPSNVNEVKALVYEKILKVTPEQNTYQLNDQFQNMGEDQMRQKQDRTQQFNSQEQMPSLPYVELSQEDVDAILQNLMNGEIPIPGNLKVNNIDFKIADGGINFTISAENYEIAGRLVPVESGKTLHMESLSNTGANGLSAMQFRFVQQAFNSYFSEKSISSLLPEQYRENFSHIEIVGNKFRIYLNN